jgi:octaprenyl-diphosphate synthase
MGAISSKASETNITLMEEFGLLVGQAFQIRDDLFGYLSYDTGKPSMNDFKQGKMTLPLIYSLTKVNLNTKNKIIKDLKNYKSIEKIISFVKENDGIEYSEKIMKELVIKASNILDMYPKSDYKNSLEKLLSYTISREI